MYLDEVVIAGLIIVALMIAFFVGVVWAIRKDIQKNSGKHDQPKQQTQS